MNTRNGRIVGEVTYREGDGAQLPIRPGPVEITETPQDVTLGWTDGETRGSAALPLTDFRRFVAEGAIVLDDAPEGAGGAAA